MARRYSGAVRVTVLYNDSTQRYDARVSWPGGSEVVFVGEAAFPRRAVDSPDSYDAAARAAITFADGAGEHADWADHGIVVSRRVYS